MKKYSVLRTAFLSKFFLCQMELKERGFDWTVPPKREGDHYLVAHVCSQGKEEPLWVRVSTVSFPLSQDVHHMARRGKNYLNVGTWLAVSRANHNHIEANPSWSRERGYLISL